MQSLPDFSQLHFCLVVMKPQGNAATQKLKKLQFFVTGHFFGVATVCQILPLCQLQ